MSMLIKPYTIAVYKDISSDSGFGFSEQRLGVIGSDTMDYQGKVLQPELTRNVNGKNRLTFKMYRRFVDTVTGEKVTNPFVDWLVSEAKVKLNYEDKWYDFIVKHINENSSTYLCTYQLEDALAQELSKNGFGVTLDARLMNNIGNSQELGNYVMAETDWTVEADTIVETVEEPLVYIAVPAGTVVTHVLDQSSDDEGVTTEEITLTEDITALAFYSCCKNEPHRFQFIYSNKGYNPETATVIASQDDRVICEADCQYYIDNPTYRKITDSSCQLDISLPNNIDIAVLDYDSLLSSLYRGKRYGFAQQSVYVPLLDRYCSRYTKNSALINPIITLYGRGSDNGGIVQTEGIYEKSQPNTGLKISIPNGYQNNSSYKLSYVIKVEEGSLSKIGGLSDSFLSSLTVYNCSVNGTTYTKGEKIGDTKEDSYSFSSAKTAGTYLWIEGKYLKVTSEGEGTPYLFIQPNKGIEGTIKFSIPELTMVQDGEYLGYVDTEYVSPTLIQNYINNYNFDSTAGWTMTSSYRTSLQEPSSVVNCYGRFKETSGGKMSFVSMLDDFLSGEYSTEHEYKAYMKLTFTDANQFVLNSGLRDNRTIIGDLPVGQELALNLKILNDSGIETNDLTPSIGEYVYSSSNSCYNARTGFITIEKQNNFDGKQIYKVTSSNYTKETFKENSRLYLKITAPTNFIIDSNNGGKNVPKIFYIETASLYKKVIADGKIIEPDYDSENSVAADAFTDGILKKTYNYFPRWLIDEEVITAQESLPLVVSDTLSYSEFVPIYNTGAEKIRTVTASESNYFNIIQSIAETFGQWPELEITRNADGSIQTNGKKIRFKNYRGAENHAGFRYGVNLKDITRDYASNNIVTKLLVKQNSNEHAENGMCTIQRAGANPTGENYLYDFSYYQNVGLMDAEDFLTENYYINYDDAKGPDMGLWEGQTATDDITLNGYYLRVKKLNDTLAPINEQVSGKKIDLIQYQSEEKVAKATYDAALSGIEQTKEDFKALAGVYPNEIQQDKIKTVTVTSALPQESWYVLDPAEPTVEGDNITVGVKTIATDLQVYPTPQLSGLTRHQTASNYVYKISTSNSWDGIYLDFEYNRGSNYVLEYDITLNETAIVDKTSTLVNIGCHNDNTFEQSTEDKYKDLPFIKVTRISNNKSVSCDFESNRVDIRGLLNDGETELPKGGNSLLHVVVQGVYRPSESATQSYFWLQPNRGVETPVTCTISNIKMFERGSVSNTSGSNRKAYVDLTVQITTDENIVAPLRKYTLEVPIMAGSETGSAVQTVAIVDTNRTDIKKYLEEYTTYTEKLNSSTADKIRLSGNISTIKNEIASLETCQKNYLEWKQKLNQIFFKKYSRFIQEGTWLDEEYVDDDKYYADAQSVLYNSCHPQAAYTISVLELSQLPGYEQFKFNLGDTTWVIDEEFFGNDKKMEVTITEKINRLDDPTQNKIKVQTSKEQFKDLFQRITAAVQQAQYSAGDYKKGSALMDANKQKQSEFITDALNSAASFLAPGKSHTVTWEGGDGITVTDDTTPTNQVKIVGGAILLSAEHPETKEQTWITGVTNKGVSASLITAGKLNTGEVQIMSGDEPVFRWDAYGISAYDAVWTQDGELSTISGINSKKFVRFDKNGIYGINAAGIDGATWHPGSITEIDEKATFALTWEGLKVTGETGSNGDTVVARIGKLDGKILEIGSENEDEKTPLMSFSNDGTLTIGKWQVTQDGLSNGMVDGTGAMRSSKAEPVIFLKPQGQKQTINGKEEFVVFRAGKNFLVTKEGTLYANSGRFGGIEIKEEDTTGEWLSAPIRSAKEEAINAAASDAATKANAAEKSAKDYAEGQVEEIRSNLQEQIDGNISTYFLPYLPVASRYPVIDGTSSDGPGDGEAGWGEKYIEHNGDLFYVTSPDGEVFTQTDEPTKIEGIYWIHPDSNQEIIIQKCVVTSAEDPTLKWETLAADTEEAKIVGKIGYCYRWQYTDSTNETAPTNSNWVLITDTAIAEALADAAKAQSTADGKMTVYASLKDENDRDIVPRAGDLLIPTTDIAGTNYKAGKVWKYNGTAWEEIKYTDDTSLNDFKISYNKTLNEINTQLDAKAETHYGPTDPAVYSGENAWGANRIGDLWHCTAEIKNGDTVVRGKDTEWIWQGTTSNGVTTYAWHEMAIADEVFDKIDGKSNIFTGLPGNGVQVNEGDLLIPATEQTSGGKTYTAGKVYRRKNENWEEVDYTDVNTVNTKIGEIQIGGRNLLQNSSKEVTRPIGTQNGEFIQYADIAPIFDKYGLIEYTISFDIKSADISIQNTVQLYCQNGSSSKHSIGQTSIPVTTEYTRQYHTFTPTVQNSNDSQSMLAFYGNYGTGNIPSVKNVKIEKGNKATDWTAAPEDLDATISTIQTQVDGKAEIYYQSVDPKPTDGSWDNEESIGNMWRDTTNNKEYVWQYDSTKEEYVWHEMEIPNNVFDAYDGKATLFVEKPENGYKRKDLWILEKQGIDSTAEHYDGTYPPYKKGTLVVASNDSNSYTKDDWVEKTRYTDDAAANAAQNAADAAQQAADAAQSAANTAQKTADAAQQELEKQGQAVSRLTGDIYPTTGDNIITTGIRDTVNKAFIDNFGIQAGSILIYSDGNAVEANKIFSAETKYDKNGKANGGAVYLAGWTVTEKQLTNGIIGKADSFGIYPSGIVSGLSKDFIWQNEFKSKLIYPIEEDQDAWILTAGDQFGLTKKGVIYANAGQIGSLTIANIERELKRNSMSCSITSSAGTNFSSTSSGKTILTAYIYEGTTELLPESDWVYTWCAVDANNISYDLGTRKGSKDIEVDIARLVGKSVYFTVDTKDGNDNSILNLARLGAMNLGQS